MCQHLVLPYLFTAPVLPSLVRAEPATARVLRAKHAASNPLALPARVPAHRHTPRRSVRGGAGRLARVPPRGAGWLWHTPSLPVGGGPPFPPDQDRGSSRRPLRPPDR